MGSEKLFCYADESSTPYEENEHDWSEQDEIILEKVITQCNLDQKECGQFTKEEN